MTRDDIIKLAREACGDEHDPFVSGWITFDYAELERFAALVAAAEREACANLCDDIYTHSTEDWEGADRCGDAIRARGNT